ncbi:MAG: AI-2E family transporter [Candidatus Omnitrophica bacterium]|nr:AI-2E family transporter [Candidatus Omnitrophota bacterium]
MTRDQFISVVFLAFLAFVVVQIFLILAPFSRAIFWSAILAFGFYPLYEKLRKEFKANEILTAALMTGVIFLLVIPPVVVLILNVAGQAIELYQSAVLYIQGGGLEKLIDQIRSFQFVQGLEARLFQWDPVKQAATDWILRSTRAIGDFATSQTAQLTKNAFLVGLNTVLMTFLIFVFLKDGAKIHDFIYQIAPFEERTKKSIFRELNETFSAVIRGQLLSGLIQALLTAVIFWVLGLPLPILFAALTFLTALIPVVGASAIWVPFVIYLFLQAHTVKAVILFLFGLLVISLTDNIVKPALIGEKTKLPYFLLFFGILGGMKLYGLMGIFIAPVILSLFFALVKIYQEKYL